MTIALIVVMAVYLAIASLIALNSVFEAERCVLAAKDLVVIVLVSVAWPIAGCVLLLAQACLRLFLRRRWLLPVVR
ncbi:hypothetical protein [Bosea sp. LjRoot237]|uniref:hypothetical protein n=1 Tax=Bosea sp. LjRoot237 TaxID=3342292 RepID=UPI003ECD2770